MLLGKVCQFRDNLIEGVLRQLLDVRVLADDVRQPPLLDLLEAVRVNGVNVRSGGVAVKISKDFPLDIICYRIGNLSPSMRRVNCIPMMQEKVGPTAASCMGVSARPPTNRSMSSTRV